MKNIYILATDNKPSRLYFNVNDKEFQICEIEKPSTILKPNRHIYITSDEEIKKGDWFYCPTTNIVNQCESDYHSKKLVEPKRFKIILTTDTDLIKDGVQAIDDEFLEWFVKNPSCEEVEIGNQSIQSFDTGHFEDFYKIIIPKDEPKQHLVDMKNHEDSLWEDEPKQETTLEEAFEKFMNQNFSGQLTLGFVLGAMKFGAKWQMERSYSEEEVIAFCEWFAFELNHYGYPTNENILKALKQFKK
jgi:hypothetical protein